MTSSREIESIQESKGTSERTLSVCLLISSLEYGGAERQVTELVRSFDKSRIRPMICSLSPEVPLAEGLLENECPLEIIEKKGRFDITAVFRFVRFIKKHRFDVVHAFLFDAEIVARLASRIAGVPLVVASERNTDYERPLLHRIAQKCTLQLFDVMVANSTCGKNFNIRTLGIPDSKIEVVHNGLDVSKYYKDREAGQRFRKVFDIPAQAPVVGMVASFKRQKGHRYFLEMAVMVLESIPDAHFIIVGGVVRERTGNSDSYASEIMDQLRSSGLEERCQFLGIQDDVLGVYNACDITTLLSLREGTPNVVLESMACEIPVVVSDASDNAILVEDKRSGFVVPKKDSRLAAERVIRLLSDDVTRHDMGKAAKRRIQAEFTLEQSATKMESVYRKHLRKKSGE